MTLNDIEDGGRACYCLAVYFSGQVNSITALTHRALRGLHLINEIDLTTFFVIFNSL